MADGILAQLNKASAAEEFFEPEARHSEEDENAAS